MLKQRIMTAIVMLAILLPTVFYPNPLAFGALAVVLIAAGAWEWAKLNQCGKATSLAVAGLCAGICLVSWSAGMLQAPLHLLWTLAGAAWVVLGAWLLRGGVKAWSAVPKGIRLCGGVIALWIAWLAVAQARIMGINFLFSVLVLVWIADIFAYFAGRTFGGRFFTRKLAPTISPGKTWEGVCGGMAGVLPWGFVWRGFGGFCAVCPATLFYRVGDVVTRFF